MLDGDNTLYFVKYDAHWDLTREFRVFVYNKKVTAISQYNGNVKCMLSGKSTSICKTLAIDIANYLENEILTTVCHKIGTNNVVCDIYVNLDNTFRIIEFNSFGYWLAAGSAFFDWKRDYAKLYNTDHKIYLKFVK